MSSHAVTQVEENMPAKSNVEWERWGDVDPLYGVAAWDGKGADDAEPWTDEEFYQLGETDWSNFLAHWQRYGVKPGTCVEIGCGAARLTRPMASFFEHVHGLDVSAGMLAKAATAVEGLPVTLHRTEGLAFPLPDASADAVFSTHVFQHLDNLEDAAANWRETVRVLRGGGTLMVHLPVRLWPVGLERLEVVYTAKRTLGDWRARAQRRKMLDAGGPPIMRGQSYLWSDLDDFLRELGLVDVELSVFRLGSNGGVHSVVLARKPA
jgi:SAM-dependent methyltransferase